MNDFKVKCKCGWLGLQSKLVNYECPVCQETFKSWPTKQKKIDKLIDDLKLILHRVRRLVKYTTPKGKDNE